MFTNLLFVQVSVVLLAVFLQLEGRPSDTNAQASNLPSDSIQILEGELEESDLPVRSLPFYGGAKGKYLLIHPSGRTSITSKHPSLHGLNKGDDDDDEDNVGMEGDGTDTEEPESGSNSTNGNEEGVAVGTPPDNASVAEAKPVGLAIAGPGGVASSRPVATAVVGPGGLALTRPVATAIAGVPGAEGLVGIPPPGGRRKHDKYKIHSANKTKLTESDEGVPSGRSITGEGEENAYYSEQFNLIQTPQMLFVPLYRSHQ